MVIYNLINFFSRKSKVCVVLYEEIVVRIRVGVSPISHIRVLIDVVDLFL